MVYDLGDCLLPRLALLSGPHRRLGDVPAVPDVSRRRGKCEHHEKDDSEFAEPHGLPSIYLPESPRGNCRLPFWKSWEMPLGLLMRYARERDGYRKRIRFCVEGLIYFNAGAMTTRRYAVSLGVPASVISQMT